MRLIQIHGDTAIDVRVFSFLLKCIEPLNNYQLDSNLYALNKKDFIEICRKECFFSDKKITKFLGNISDCAAFVKWIIIMSDYIREEFRKRLEYNKDGLASDAAYSIFERLSLKHDVFNSKSTQLM